ncbi:MAG: GntR family transcriptional regulator [Sphingomonadales bacterium]|jgi:GntR family transcriptional regulator
MFANDRPIYRQIRDTIVDRILAAGDGAMLPSVRALAAEAGVNPLTVAKAYQDLQAAGLVRAKKGVGLFAADGAAGELLAAERDAFLNEEWPRIRTRINRLGLSARELFAAV